MPNIAILKTDPAGALMFRYEGKELRRTTNEILIEALFGLEDRVLVDIPLKNGDRFLETYYNDRWFNIYEIHDRDDDSLKGWYCNVASPAEFGDQHIAFRDFALDLLVYPDGRQLVLDEDEFAALQCTPAERQQALAGLAQLQEHFRQRFAK
jgi:predicted RNA-binding protein associated with RNAse of E/G family